MTLHYLVGPLSGPQAWRSWSQARQQGHCRVFNAGGDMDLRIDAGDTWEQVCQNLPADWHPDFLALHLPFTTIPRALWTAPVPLIGLACDWHLHWHTYRHLLPLCDLVLADAPGVELMRRAGFPHVRYANLCGLDRHVLDWDRPEGERPLDLVFVGSVDRLRQPQRSAWLGRLARLAGRWRVALRTAVPERDYHALLGQARIVFNHSTHGECNRRVFEAAAAGALLFQEADNREVPRYFTPGEEYVAYDADNLEALVEHYLKHEEERRAVAAAASLRVRRYTFDNLWGEALEGVAAGWDSIQQRARQRSERAAGLSLSGRLWQAVTSREGDDPHLTRDLAVALEQQPDAAAWHHAMGLAVSLPAPASPLRDPAVCEKAAVHFRQALADDPQHAVAALNLIECLAGAGRKELAIEAARHLLILLERGLELPAAVLDAGHFPPVLDVFHEAWQRAAWSHAGQPVAEAEAKRRLLCWRLHDLLAALTGALTHYQEAVRARPDHSVTQARLGCALGLAKQPAAAAEHLGLAVAGDPFDLQAAQALYQALHEGGDAIGARRLARERGWLAQVAPQMVPAERWFLDAPPVGDELASILILCHNQVAYTRLCLDSIRRHTRPPYELILVDNGSTDDTPAYLEEVRSHPGPTRVEVLRNNSNLGFPAGCNQALRQARGRYVVFLDNDTIVTSGWLDGLIAWSLHDWPQVGLVGPVTNFSRPPQQIAVAYRDVQDLPAFAAKRRREHTRKALSVERLSGFCLLARREVLERLGDFDERFGLGFFEVDDLCVRGRQAGFRLLTAQDVFVHHFGSRTFTALGLDIHQQLQKNFEQFQTKWGAEHAAGYRLPGTNGLPAPPEPTARPTAVVSTTPVGDRPRVSLCLIVKNEEDNLPACLGSAADLADEVIVVDTGSTDATKEVAARYGARVFDFPWCDSFAAARNECLRHAHGEWIFWLDADDRLDEDNHRKLRGLFAGLNGENVAYAMKCLCLPDPTQGAATVVDHIRLFRNHPVVRWQYRVHEQILPAIRRHRGEVRWADVVIQHAGYQDAALRRRKLERDLRLLQLENAEHPDDPFTLFNLGSVRHELGQHTEALPLLRRSRERSHPGDSIVRKLYALIVACHRALNDLPAALIACQEGRKVYADDTELLFVESVLRKDQGDLAGSEACLVQLLNARPAAHFASVDTGLKGYKARHNLAVLRHQQGRSDEAEPLWQEVVAEKPDFLPAWLGLGELHLRRSAWEQVEETARRLEQVREGEVEAVVLRARVHLARREFAAARPLLEEAVTRWPRALGPRIILSHVLLQQGQDMVAAEKALRAVLELSPENAEARHNLTLLLQRHGRDQLFTDNLAIAALYEQACATPSQLHEHLPLLYSLAKECRHITELGTGTAASTTAFLYARPDKLVCYDRDKCPEIERLETLANPTEFIFHQQDVLAAEIEPTDLLLLDAELVGEHLRDELVRHAGKVRKYLVLRGSVTLSEQGEIGEHPGLPPAIEVLLAEGRLRLQTRYENNNGLTVLEAVQPPSPS